MPDQRPAPPTDPHANDVRSRGWSVVRTFLQVATAWLFSMNSAIVGEARLHESDLSGPIQVLASSSTYLGIALAMTLPFALIMRRTRPRTVFVVAATAGVFTTAGPFVAAFALVHVFRATRWREVSGATAGYLACLTAFVLTDLRGSTGDTSLLRQIFGGADGSVSGAWGVSTGQLIVVLLLLSALPISASLVVRERHSGVQIQAVATKERQSRVEATAELSRQAERELIAREVHDAIGHRLSLLSLHAGGLEVSAGADPELRQSATLVREGAQQAMTDLRSLIDVLRTGDPEPDGDLTAATGLADLSTLIDDSAGAGVPVITTVYLREAESAPPDLSRAVYRIVQELLTNARRHAAGLQVRLAVHGGPGDGVSIESVNRVHQVPGAEGHGLTGIRERVELIGGTMHSGSDGDDVFRVSIDLPWQPVPTTPAEDPR